MKEAQMFKKYEYLKELPFSGGFLECVAHGTLIITLFSGILIISLPLVPIIKHSYGFFIPLSNGTTGSPYFVTYIIHICAKLKMS